MATTVFDQNVTVTSGGSTRYNGFVIHIWAEQEGSTVSWYAQSITQYYAKTRVQDIDGYHYGDLGTAASYFVLKIGNQISNKVKAASGTNFGDNYTTISSWVRTAHETQPVTSPVTVSAPADRWDVSFDYEGGVSGTKIVQEGKGILAYFNIDDEIVPAAAIYVNVDGVIRQPAVWTNVDGAIVSLGG